MPGPQPTPSAILAARGSWRAKMRSGEPQIAVSVPDCPAWVQGPARDWWPEVAGQLAEMGVMGAPYTVALGLLVDALSDYLQARETVLRAGQTYETANGQIHTRPEVAVMERAWTRTLHAAGEFGLTPASRTRVSVSGGGKQDKPDPKARFFKVS